MAILRLRSVDAWFSATKALDAVDLDFEAGRVHALLGENGAGKTTLVSVLAGWFAPHAGSMELDGAAYAPRSPREARARGVGLVPQHDTLIGTLTVAENLELTRPPASFSIDPRVLCARAEESARRAGFALPDVRRKAADLGVGERQRVEIVRALAAAPRVLVLDEPTAVLVPAEADDLLARLRTLASRGVAVVLITHRLAEVLAVADAVTVLRRGRVIATLPRAGLSAPRLAALMVGRDAPDASAASAASAAPDGSDESDESDGSVASGARDGPDGPDEPDAPDASATPGAGDASDAPDLRDVPGAPDAPVTRVPVGAMEAADTRGAPAAARAAGRAEAALRLDAVSCGTGAAGLAAVSLAVRAGELVAVCGVDGNGQQALADVVSGLRRVHAGKVLLGAAEVTALDVGARRGLGLAIVPEDRRGTGLVPALSVAENLALNAPRLAAAGRGPWLDRGALRRAATHAIARYSIRADGPDATVSGLSGGNQQRVVLARELDGAPRVLLAFNPTRGLDVGATRFVHERLLERRADGAAILLISTDLDEVRTLADRIFVLFHGVLRGPFPSGAPRATLGLAMGGGVA